MTATPTTNDLGALTAVIEQELAEQHLPAGVTATLGGASAEQQEAFSQLGLAMLLAIGLVFLIMVAAFRSLVQPLILLVSIPFAATGAVGALLLTDTPLGVPAMVGLLMLIGIVVTNAIVLIDLINQKRNGIKIAKPAAKASGNVINLMDALKKSLANEKQAAPAKADAKAAKGKKPKKRIEGQREMLLPISGSGKREPKEATKPEPKKAEKATRAQGTAARKKAG